MTDKEMWARIEAACARLDRIREGVQRGVRKVLLPAALGTGLALGGAGCGGARTVQVDGGLVADTIAPPVAPVYADPFPEPELDAAADAAAPPILPEYGTPFPDDPPATDLGADAVPPLAPAYGAPFYGPDSGPVDAELDGPLTGGRYGTPFPS